MHLRARSLMLVAALFLSVSCASNDQRNPVEPSGQSDGERLGDKTVGELLGVMETNYEEVRPIFECIEASGKVELRDGDDYSDEDYERALPVKNGLSAEGRECAKNYEEEYAAKVFAACVSTDCGAGHSNGCIATLPFLRNMAVIFDAAYACASGD